MNRHATGEDIHCMYLPNPLSSGRGEQRIKSWRSNCLVFAFTVLRRGGRGSKRKWAVVTLSWYFLCLPLHLTVREEVYKQQTPIRNPANTHAQGGRLCLYGLGRLKLHEFRSDDDLYAEYNFAALFIWYSYSRHPRSCHIITLGFFAKGFSDFLQVPLKKGA